MRDIKVGKYTVTLPDKYCKMKVVTPCHNQKPTNKDVKGQAAPVLKSFDGLATKMASK